MTSSETLKMLQQFNKELKKASQLAVTPPETSEFQGKRLNARVVRKAGDLIFQFFLPKFPADFPTLLAEVVESHFGGTDDFKLDHVPELNSYALLAKGILDRPTVRIDYVTTDFLNLLDEVLNSPEIKGQTP
jgi:hypothetical protein